MNILIRFSFLIVIVLSSCKATKTNLSSSEDKLINKIEAKLGHEAIRLNNFDNSYVLAYREDKSSGTPVLRYGVWVIESGKLLYAGTAIRGNVKWLDNSTLLVEDYPGIVEEGRQNYKFKVDLKTKVKIPVNENRN